MGALILTADSVAKISLTKSGQVFYRDSKLKGFGLRVGTKSKIYYAETKVDGRTVRCTIGQHGTFTAEQARKEAKQRLGEMARGVNPNDEKKAKRARSVTLLQVFDDFLAARKSLKPRTLYDYRRMMGQHNEADRQDMNRPRNKPRNSPGYFKDWQKKPIAEITKDMIEKRHRQLGETSQAQANLAMRFLRALFYFAMAKYEDSEGHSLMSENPVKRLSQTRSWYRVERRQTVIKPHELKPWYAAVRNLKGELPHDKAEVVKDYLVFILLTGLRRQESASLRWADVDLKHRTFTIQDTKNRESHSLPLPDHLAEMLERRKVENQSLGPEERSQYVFPGVGKKGYIVEPRVQIERVVESSGIAFTLHDLRRTFTTIAESLDVPAYALKRLLNHKTGGDVTAGYIVADVERLRKPMQVIEDFILKAAGVRASAMTVQLGQKVKTR